jgi:hypothetical protein
MQPREYTILKVLGVKGVSKLQEKYGSAMESGFFAFFSVTEQFGGDNGVDGGYSGE